MEKVKTTSKPTQPKLKISIAACKRSFQNNFKKDHSSKWGLDGEKWGIGNGE